MPSEHATSPFLPYGRQSIDAADIAAVTAVLRGEFLTTGPNVTEFETRFAEYVGVRHAVAVNSATAALHLAAAAAGLGRGDRVITSPNTFLASANAAAFVGATPDFADIDDQTSNLSPIALEATWQDDVRAIIPVDYAGQPCDMPMLAAIARRRGAIVIEDASHGVGGGFVAEGKTWRIGAHPWADMTVFSFHPVKTMTTGEGGMLVTNNDAFADKARQLRAHGINRTHFIGLGEHLSPALAERGPWYYEMQDLGWNYRITDIQCALGLSQLQRLDGFIGRRREIVSHYNAAFADVPWLTTPSVKAPAQRDLVSWHLYTLQIDFPALDLTRTQAMQRLREWGVGSQVLYIPVYLQPWYRQTYGYKMGKCPAAERVYQRSLSIPLYPGLTTGDVERVVAAVLSLAY
jgi:UDP-4-amino-4,6-dideoxy-N-acetyl-beta-L-altrosamine transaminase